MTDSDKSGGIAASVLSFFKRSGRARILIIFFALGALLILIGAFGSDGGTTQTEDTLEQRLEDICSSLEGVGSCRVMLGYAESSTRYGSSAEKRVESVAVVCKGADRPAVRAKLTELFSALYGISTSRISISKMK